MLGENDESALLPLSRMSLIAMQRIFKAADSFETKVKFWFLLLDTDPKVYLSAPSALAVPSSRIGRRYSSLPPFVYLGLNQMAHQVRIATAGESLSLKHLSKFGRPVSVPGSYQPTHFYMSNPGTAHTVLGILTPPSSRPNGSSEVILFVVFLLL